MKMMHQSCVVLFCLTVGSQLYAQEQTELQKLLMDRHKKNLVKTTTINGKEATTFDSVSAEYLVKRKRGVPVIEDALAKHAGPIGSTLDPWVNLLYIYERHVAVEDVPDKVIPAFAHRFQKLVPSSTSSLQFIEQAAEFGPRGKAFLPALEKIRDEATDQQLIRRATEAIAAIKK